MPGRSSEAALRAIEGKAPRAIEAADALRVAPFWRGVRIISETLAGVPLQVVRRDEDGAWEPVPDHPLQAVLGREAAPHTSAFEFREVLQIHLLVVGNAFAEIGRVGGKVRSLRAIPPECVTIETNGEEATGRYLVTTVDGTATVGRDRILHLRGPGWDGHIGLRMVDLATGDLHIARASQSYAGNFFRQGATPTGVVTVENALSDDAIRGLRRSLQEGVDGAHRVLILEDGTQWSAMSVDPDKSQLLPLRQQVVQDMARWLGVPPHLLADLSDATYSNIESQRLEFSGQTLRGWARRWEAQLGVQLFTARERMEGLALRHDLDEVVRADSAVRSGYFSAALQAGWMTPNEVRRAEGLPPIEGGDELKQPAHMEPAGGGEDKEATPREPETEDDRSGPELYVLGFD